MGGGQAPEPGYVSGYVNFAQSFEQGHPTINTRFFLFSLDLKVEFKCRVRGFAPCMLLLIPLIPVTLAELTSHAPFASLTRFCFSLIEPGQASNSAGEPVIDFMPDVF